VESAVVDRTGARQRQLLNQLGKASVIEHQQKAPEPLRLLLGLQSQGFFQRWLQLGDKFLLLLKAEPSGRPGRAAGDVPRSGLAAVESDPPLWGQPRGQLLQNRPPCQTPPTAQPPSTS